MLFLRKEHINWAFTCKNVEVFKMTRSTRPVHMPGGLWGQEAELMRVLLCGMVEWILKISHPL